jgi:hypothetical protein
MTETLIPTGGSGVLSVAGATNLKTDGALSRLKLLGSEVDFSMTVARATVMAICFIHA